MLLPLAITGIGGGMFACFLSYYILSFESDTDEYGTSISLNEDYLILFLLGLFLFFLGLYMLIQRLKKNPNTDGVFHGGAAAISGISSVYALFMVVKSYVKGDSLTPFYWGWLLVSILLLCFGLSYFFQGKKKEK